MAVQITTNLSIWLQLASFISLGGLTIPVSPRHEILKELIKVEMGVQVVELGFYWTLLKKLSTTNVGKMAQTRYYDWILTTPTMLFTTIVYLAYEKYPDRILTISTVWEENRVVIQRVLICNFMMLMVGYLGEIGKMKKKESLVIGFIFLFLGFFYIRDAFVENEASQKVFNVMLFLWTLYGAAAMLDEEQKNISYNFLDLFAKNFFGIYLYLKVRSLRQ